MPKGVVENVIGGVTAGTKLREMIRQLEIDVVNLKGKGEKILDIYALRDQVGEEYKRLVDQGLNLKAEETRIETCDLILARQVQLIENELKKIGGLAGARKQRMPSEDLKYWFIDVPYYAARKQRTRSLLIALPIIAVVLVAIAFISIKLWGPGNVRQRANTQFVNGQKYMERGDLTSASKSFQSAIKILKNYGEAMTYYGVVLEKQGNETQAKTWLTDAQNVMKDRRRYLMTLGKAYEYANDITKAEETYSLLIKTSPNYEDAYYERGLIYEKLGEYQAAFDDFTKAEDLAQKSGNKATYDNALLRLNIVKKTISAGS
ncbi:MAG: tetratricopeptide repeat protein [Anaerolineae bacterium]